MSIPVVDLSEFSNSNPFIKKGFIEKIGKSFEEVNFVSVIHHEIYNSLIKNLYKYVKQFFSLPTEKKLQYEIPALAGQRGYTSFGREHAKGSNTPDLKEFFQYGQIVSDDDPVKAEYSDNIEVQEIPGFNETLYQAYKSFERSGMIILQEIAIYLDLDEYFFDSYIHNGNSILRCIHYPPITTEPDSAIRAEHHEDINLITLLVGASAEGLEILSNKNKWEAVISSPDKIVVNAGDMLQRLTNNRFRSTTHRVINPSKDLWHTSRYSIPFFLHPKSSISLACLTSTISKENHKAYSDTTAGEYLEERLREIGLKK